MGVKGSPAKSSKPERKAQAAAGRFSSRRAGAGAQWLRFHHRPGREGRRTIRCRTCWSEGLRQQQGTQDLYTKYAGAYESGQNVLNLQLVQDFGKVARPARTRDSDQP